MKKLFLIFLITLSISTIAQNEQNTRFSDNLFFGGGLGLSFGNMTNIEISPLVGYMLTEDFHAGLQIRYQYIRANYYYNSYLYDFRTDIFGAAPFLRYFVLDEYYLISEFELLSLETEYFDVLNLYDNNPDKERFIYTGVFVGAGYAQRFSEKSMIYFSVLYNLNESSNSPYSSPLVVRTGINF
ncbi:MAG: hypothetical protein JXR58_02975 [Bacteroidales bacterium]|nr:hypothetical protein [Bacteroidales bacterium]